MQPEEDSLLNSGVGFAIMQDGEDSILDPEYGPELALLIIQYSHEKPSPACKIEKENSCLELKPSPAC